jgi:hypothetical protein
MTGKNKSGVYKISKESLEHNVIEVQTVSPSTNDCCQNILFSVVIEYSITCSSIIKHSSL